MYLVLYEDSYMSPGYDPGDAPYSTKYKAFKEFEDEAALLEWIRREEEKSTYTRLKSYRIVKAEELTLKKTLNLELK